MLKRQAKPVRSKNDKAHLSIYFNIVTASIITIAIIINSYKSNYHWINLDCITNTDNLHFPFIVLPLAMASSFRFRSTSTPIHLKYGTGTGTRIRSSNNNNRSISRRRLFTNNPIHFNNRDVSSLKNIFQNRSSFSTLMNNGGNYNNNNNHLTKNKCYTSFISNHRCNGIGTFTKQSSDFLLPSSSSSLLSPSFDFYNNHQQYYTYQRRSKRISFSTMSATKKNDLFHHGDKVQIVDQDGTNCVGLVSERKGGWYTVQIENADGTLRDVKRRANQMKRMLDISQTQLKAGSDSSSSDTATTITTNTAAADDIGMFGTTFNDESKFNIVQNEKIDNVPNVPTIIDLDAAMSNQKVNKDIIKNEKDKQYLEQCAEFTKYKKWVMFTDLHCSPASLNTCIHVLEKVHKTAKEQGAGVLFLGDFWHHRGTVRVDCLNAILNSLSDWEVPMIMVSMCDCYDVKMIESKQGYKFSLLLCYHIYDIHSYWTKDSRESRPSYIEWFGTCLDTVTKCISHN